MPNLCGSGCHAMHGDEIKTKFFLKRGSGEEMIDWMVMGVWSQQMGDMFLPFCLAFGGQFTSQP